MPLTIHRRHFRRKKPLNACSSVSSQAIESSSSSSSSSEEVQPPPEQPIQEVRTDAEGEPQPGQPSLNQSLQTKAPPRPIPPGKNHYATLNIPISATPADIRLAYRNLLDQVPNKGDNTDVDSTYAQVLLDDAAHVLTHPYKKSIFDRAYTYELITWEKEQWLHLSFGEAQRRRNRLDKWNEAMVRGLKYGDHEVIVRGLKCDDQDPEAEFGRIPWAKVVERKWQFRLEEDFGGTLEEVSLWGPSLMAGAVGGFEGWTG